MGICAANMEECDIKKKCIFGPNEGQAYNPSDPCCGQGEFDAATCDCVDACYGPGVYLITWTANYTKTARTNCSETPNCNVNCSEAIIECGARNRGGSFIWTNIYSSACIVPVSYSPFTDICEEERFRESGYIYSCGPGLDPLVDGCGFPLASFSPSGCSNGAINGSFTVDVVLVEDP